jgi:hypothetical protein
MLENVYTPLPLRKRAFENLRNLGVLCTRLPQCYRGDGGILYARQWTRAHFPRHSSHTAALGWRDLRILRRGVELAARCPARAYSRQLLAFDNAIAAVGIHEAARIPVSIYMQRLAVHGSDLIPSAGPVLLLQPPWHVRHGLPLCCYHPPRP